MRRVPATVMCLLLGVTGSLAAQDSPPRKQLSFEASPTYAGAISFAGRLDDSDFLLGFGAGFAWELNHHSFDDSDRT